jgi:hypothetical protein
MGRGVVPGMADVELVVMAASAQEVDERGRTVEDSGYIDTPCMKVLVDIAEVVG